MKCSSACTRTHTSGRTSTPERSESFHIVQGEVDVLIFDDRGPVSQQVVSLGEFSSRKPFYYRQAVPAFHCVLPRTPSHSSMRQPPARSGRVIRSFPTSAPAENESEAVATYLGRLRPSQGAGGSLSD